MSWIAEYDTQGREFPTCVHVTKTTGTMTHGATYVPIEDGKAVRAENAKLRELADRAWKTAEQLCQAFDGPCRSDGVTVYKPCPMGERDEECVYGQLQRELRELGIEVD